jgi:hypothetical protein
MRINMVDVYCIHIHSFKRMKPVEIVLRKGREKRDNDGGNKSN